MFNDTVAHPDPLLGKTVGTCRIAAVLGGGGMGTVYRAHHIPLDRPVAVKIISPELMAGPQAVEAFLTEARHAARIDDPRVVQVYEVGKDAGLYYIVMQLAVGCTLEQRLRRDGPLSQVEARRVIREIARGLDAAHRLGIVHRDIKPANIMQGDDGGIRIMDFGLAGIAYRAKDAIAGGSFGFMSPEQGLGGPPDPRMDLYSLGATYFYLLSGRPPYTAAKAADIMLQHRDAPVPDVREVRRDVSAAAAELIRRLMAKDPAQRPANVAELLRELDSHRLLIDIDASGSPFKLLPPAVEPQVGFDAGAGFAPAVPPAAVEPFPSETAPIPSPAVSGYKRTRVWPMGAAVVALLFGLHWRLLARPDLAAAGFFAMFLAAGTFFRLRRRLSLRLAAGGSAFAVMAGMFYLYGSRGLGPFAAGPDFHAMLLAGLGVVSAGGALYLGAVEAHKQERALAYCLLAASSGLLFLAALSLRIPAGLDWRSGMAACLADESRLFLASFGAWRWGGLAMLGLLWWGLLDRPDPVRPPGPKAAVSNWNR